MSTRTRSRRARSVEAAVSSSSSTSEEEEEEEELRGESSRGRPVGPAKRRKLNLAVEGLLGMANTASHTNTPSDPLRVVWRPLARQGDLGYFQFAQAQLLARYMQQKLK